MEKLKDFIHDYTDIVLAVVIAISMFSVVNWHLSSWLPTSNTVIAANTNNYNQSNSSKENEKVDNEKEIVEKEKGVVEEKKEEVSVPEPTTPTTPTPPADKGIIVVDNIKITIPDGSTGQAIGRLLKEHGLIEEVSHFISEAERLKLTSRLRSGTFQIPENASIEQIVKIIANQR